MTSIIDLPLEILGPYILQQISAKSLKVILSDRTIFNSVKTFYPSIARDCFIHIKPLKNHKDNLYDNVHDMKRYILSKEGDLTEKVITILKYEKYFVNAYSTIIRLLENINLSQRQIICYNILKHEYSCNSSKILTSLIETLIYKMSCDPSIGNNEIIRMASEKGHLEVVKLLLKDSRVNPYACNWVIQCASRKGHLEIVKILLRDARVDPSYNNNYSITTASQNGNLQIVKLLLSDPRVDPSVWNNYAIRFASNNGHASVVKLLLSDPRVNPSACGNYAIRWACRNGHLQVVKILLEDPRVDPSADDNYAIRNACENGHKAIVKILIKNIYVNSSDKDSEALICACKNGYTSIVRMLLNDSRVDNISYAVQIASDNEHYRIVDILLGDK